MRAALTALLVFCSGLLAGQAPTVRPPAAAQAHMAQHHPETTVHAWKQGAKLFRAEFVLKGRKHTAVYTADGEWVRTEHDLAKSEIPAPVKRALMSSQYGTWTIADGEEHTTPDHARLIKLNVESEEQKAEIFFLPDGRVLKEEVKDRKKKAGKGG
jgi:hypothetical protein